MHSLCDLTIHKGVPLVPSPLQSIQTSGYAAVRYAHVLVINLIKEITMKNTLALIGVCLVLGSIAAKCAGSIDVFELGIGVVIGVALACLAD